MHDQITIVRVPFQSGHLEAIQRMDGIWVVIKRMCEDIGLTSNAQVTKLEKAPWAVTTKIVATGPDGKNYTMSMLRADCIAMWLSGLNAAKVAPRYRLRMEALQTRARDVLAAYFTPGAAHDAGVDVEAIGAAIAESGRQLKEHDARLARIEASRAEDHTTVGLLAGHVDALKVRFRDFDDDHPNGLFGVKEARELRSLICQTRDIRIQLGDKSKPLTVFIQADNAVRTHVGYVRSSAASWEFATISVGRDAKSFAARELESLRQKLQREQRKDKRQKRDSQLDLGFDKAGKKRLRRIK